MYRVGVDVGGTNTDCAILELEKLDTQSRGVLVSSKTPTTVDITSGIIRVVENVLQESRIDKEKVLSVTIGTTHFVNAVVEADERRLSQVAVVRLCGPSTRHIPPFTDYPLGLRRIMKGPIYYLDGGLEIDGREILPLNPKQIEETALDIQTQGFTKVALVGVFSPLDHAGMHEERCKELMLKAAPKLDVVCSHTIGGVGLLERENATILNASILAVAQNTVRGFKTAMKKLRLSCPLYLTQNDGTLTGADDAAKLPIKTFASGPTNSMTGAAFLAGLDKGHGDTSSQVLVVDIGGTTTDICALLPSGFPRQAPNFVEVGGVRTAFSMPDVLSVGLGGGSRVGVNCDDKVTVGPDSVGHYLTTRALVFGGSITTSTDIVVASGKEQIGEPSLVSSVPEEVVNAARKEIKAILQRAIEAMKVSAAPVTVLLVGGGSIVYMDELEGVTKCIIPPHHDSANAVGAAISKVAGEVDIIEILDGRDEMEVVKLAEASAIQAAIAKGADPEDVRIVEIEKIPLQYVSNKATRIKVKAIGKLKTPEAMTASLSDETLAEERVLDEVVEGEKVAAGPDSHKTMTKPSLDIDIEKYRPEVRDKGWFLSEVDLEFIACGTGILGTGGGGPSYLAYLVALDALRAGGQKMRVISPDYLNDDDTVVFGSWYGAPSVAGERLSAGTEIPAAIDALNKIMGVKEFHALLADEIGGGNGLATFPTSVHYDRPTIDGDMMGRAQEPANLSGTPYVYGHPIAPCAMADAKGNVSIVMSAESNARLEKMLRATCIELGLKTSVVARPLQGAVIKDFVVPNTISQSWYLGRAVHLARRNKTSYVKAIFDVMPGRELFSGKVIDVTRDVSKGGYTVGRCLIAPLSNDEVGNDETRVEKRHLLIPFQNEFLYAAYTDEKGREGTEVICTVPDLISVLGEDGEAIGSQELRYGLKVFVIGMPAHPLWTADERGLKVGGPEYFGLNMEWKSIGEYKRPRSVIEEFR
ncbi:hypothetical protein EG329_004331 [Mollisiaceae sp. DMI_Dod_QoI]|nr:hypothetical protein EG329_004331 [Helotiales sp. DMI_Dod_QoI]